MRRKLMICILWICCIGIISIPKVNATEEQRYGDLTYIIENNEITITGASKPDAPYLMFVCNIPDEIEGYKVTKIKEFAFQNMTNMKTLYIGKNIKRIGEYAFQNCKALKKVTIPENVTYMGERVFYENTELESIVIEGNVNQIDEYCFSKCTNLKSVEIKGNVKNIEKEAFSNCSKLQSINLTNITRIGDNAFENCENLQEIDISENIEYIGGQAFRGTAWLKNKQLENELVIVNDILIDGTTYKQSELIIPENVHTIASSSFKGVQSLTKAIIPDTIKVETEGLFGECSNLTEVKLPCTLTEIGATMFFGCTSLQQITIPDGVTSIGMSAFKNCTNLKEITIPKSITIVRENAFSNTKWLENRKKESAMVVINNILIDGTTCKGEVIIPGNVNYIADCAFLEAKDITSIDIEEGVKQIGACAFSWCKTLKKIRLPNTLEKIDELVFYYCPELTEIVIPASVNEIGEYAFGSCDKLERVTFEGEVSSITEQIFSFDFSGIAYVKKNTPIHKYLKEFEINYKFLNSIESDDDTENYEYEIIEDNKIQITYYGGEKSILQIPKEIDGYTVTKIGKDAFRNCTNLTKVMVPNTVTEISELAFPYCTSSELIIPESVIKIGNNAFYGYTGIIRLTKSKDAQYSASAFNKFNGEIFLTFQEGTESIKKHEFSNNKCLKEIVIPNTVTEISDYAFVNCTNLEKVIIPESVVWIDSSAFYNCENLTIYTYKGAYAEEYAKAVGHKYKLDLPFEDVNVNTWYYGAVKYNYENKIILGLNNTTFSPNTNLTRGMLVTILNRMEGSPKAKGTSKFADVKDSSKYYYNSVIWATENKIVSGYDNGKFGPNDPITREQLAIMLNKYCRYKGKYKEVSGNLSKFKDANKIAPYAVSQMKWAVGTGVITGNASTKTLNPKGNATRAEVASMLYKYCTRIK